MNKNFDDNISSLCDTTMDKVVNDLFENCDIENSGYVKVSDLINFIEPFLKENMAALIDLKHSLDPEEKDPLVDLNTVFSVMTVWSSKMKEKEHEQSLVLNDTVNEEKRDPIAFSTPFKPVSLISLFDESDNLFAIHEDTGMPSSTSMNDLLCQYRKVKEEAEVGRNIQNMQEDMIDKLNVEIKEFKMNNVDLKLKIRNLQKEKEEYEDLMEMLNKEEFKVKQLNKSLEHKQKELDEMQRNYDNLENQNDNLIAKIDTLTIERKEHLQIIAELEIVVNVKDTEIASMQTTFTVMQEERNEQDEYLRHIVENNEILKTEKSTYEKCLWKTLHKGTNVKLTHRPSLPIMSSTSSSISSSSSISGRTVQNNDINEFHPEFVTDRFSFFNHDNPYVRIRSNRHSIGTPSHTEVLRECKRFNSPHLLNILTKSPLSPILDNSLLSRLKGNRSSQDTLITPSKKLYDNTGNVDFKSLMTINNDLQLSFHEDVIKCEVDYINLDHSNYESLQSEMLQADNTAGYERICQDYEDKIKTLEEENDDLRNRLKKVDEKEQFVKYNNDIDKLDISCLNRNKKLSKYVAKNSNMNKLEIKNLRLSEKLDTTLDKLKNEQAKLSELEIKLYEYENLITEYKLVDKEKTMQHLDLLYKYRNVLQNYKDVTNREIAINDNNEQISTTTPFKKAIGYIWKGTKTIFTIIKYILMIIIFINFIIVITHRDARTLIIPVKPNEAYGFIFEVRRLPGRPPI